MAEIRVKLGPEDDGKTLVLGMSGPIENREKPETSQISWWGSTIASFVKLLSFFGIGNG